MRLLAIDPGPLQSGWALIDTVDNSVIDKDVTENNALLTMIYESDAKELVIEMVANYGMNAGASLFDTCVWIGRFYQAYSENVMDTAHLVYRKDVKLHHCRSVAAKDPNIVQALVDRFTRHEPNRGKGTKDKPGWFHGFHSHIWQAYALAVYWSDVNTNNEGIYRGGAS